MRGVSTFGTHFTRRRLRCWPPADCRAAPRPSLLRRRSPLLLQYEPAPPKRSMPLPAALPLRLLRLLLLLLLLLLLGAALAVAVAVVSTRILSRSGAAAHHMSLQKSSSSSHLSLTHVFFLPTVRSTTLAAKYPLTAGFSLSM